MAIRPSRALPYAERLRAWPLTPPLGALPFALPECIAAFVADQEEHAPNELLSRGIARASRRQDLTRSRL